jgi:tRNA splicing ligase
LDHGYRPVLDAKTSGANRLKFTLDGKLVLISSLGDGDLVVYEAASRKKFKSVHIGHTDVGGEPDGLAWANRP